MHGTGMSLAIMKTVLYCLAGSMHWNVTMQDFLRSQLIRIAGSWYCRFVWNMISQSQCLILYLILPMTSDTFFSGMAINGELPCCRAGSMLIKFIESWHNVVTQMEYKGRTNNNYNTILNVFLKWKCLLENWLYVYLKPIHLVVQRIYTEYMGHLLGMVVAENIKTNL